LSFALERAARAYKTGQRDYKELRRGILEVLQAEPLAKIEYVDLVDPDTFIPPGSLAVMAVWIGKTRLIDNHDLAQPFSG
jgi:pantoate--beta-alanine ligase